MTDPEKYLSDEAVAEFDRIVREYERPAKIRRFAGWAAGIAAAASVALPLLVPRSPSGTETPIDPIVVAEGITHLMELEPDDIVSIEAVPEGSKAFLTVKMKNGGTRSFVMTAGQDGESFTLTANNN